MKETSKDTSAASEAVNATPTPATEQGVNVPSTSTTVSSTPAPKAEPEVVQSKPEPIAEPEASEETTQTPIVRKETRSIPKFALIGPCPHCHSESTCNAGGSRHCNSCGRNF